MPVTHIVIITVYAMLDIRMVYRQPPNLPWQWLLWHWAWLGQPL